MCELAVARRLLVRSYLPCPRFSTLVRYGCLLAQLIELDHIRSPGTPRVVLSVRRRRGQRGFWVGLAQLEHGLGSPGIEDTSPTLGLGSH